MKRLTFLVAVALPIAPLVAQINPRQPIIDGSAAASQTVPPGAVAPGFDPGTRAANGMIADEQAANQAQHAADVAAYDAAVRAHGRQIMQQDARYARQQAAYADAMAAWRAQAEACNRGSRVACNSPTPDPANF